MLRAFRSARLSSSMRASISVLGPNSQKLSLSLSRSCTGNTSITPFDAAQRAGPRCSPAVIRRGACYSVSHAPKTMSANTLPLLTVTTRHSSSGFTWEPRERAQAHTRTRLEIPRLAPRHHNRFAPPPFFLVHHLPCHWLQPHLTQPSLPEREGGERNPSKE